MAARSSWVNANRNPRLTEAQITARILSATGATRLLWVDGLLGQDITDGHIDTLVRFVGTDTLVIEMPAVADTSDPWWNLAVATKVRPGV